MIIDWVLWASFILGVYATYWLTEYLLQPEETKWFEKYGHWLLIFGVVGAIPSVCMIVLSSWIGWQWEKVLRKYPFFCFPVDKSCR